MSGNKKRKPTLCGGATQNVKPIATPTLTLVALAQVPVHSLATSEMRLSGLAGLASVPIETSIVNDLSGSLHGLFDHVCDMALPIYFGPLLGRLYLEGL